jgi:ribosomal protein S18 acetylase RimI-like enzyme
MATIIRKAVLSDAPSIGKVHVESWRITYKGIIPSSYLDNLNPASSAKKFEADILDGSKKRFVYVAEVDKAVVGFAIGGPERESSKEDAGEVYAIYILRDFQGQGVGRELLSACREEFLDRDFEKMNLYVLADNPYQRFYESAGGVLESHEGFIEIGGQKFKLFKYVWDLTKK